MINNNSTTNVKSLNLSRTTSLNNTTQRHLKNILDKSSKIKGPDIGKKDPRPTPKIDNHKF